MPRTVAAPPNKIAEIREERGLTRTQLAGRLIVSERTLYRWEIGESQIPDHRKIELAEELSVSIADLMGWD